MRIEELKTKVIEEAREIQKRHGWHILKRLKKYGFTYAKDVTVFNVCLVLAWFKNTRTYITPPLFSWLKDMSYTNAVTILHNLGDRKILTLLRKEGSKMNYYIPSTFLQGLAKEIGINLY